jgi:hypothetical protein
MTLLYQQRVAYRDIDLYKSRPEHKDDPNKTDICSICLRTPRVWVLLLPCYHTCCVSCALVFHSMDVEICHICREPFTMGFPHIQRLPPGYGYAGEECTTLYQWYTTSSKPLDIKADAMALFRYTDHATTEKHLVAWRYLLDKGQDCDIDDIGQDALLKQMYRRCSLCTTA